MKGFFSLGIALGVLLGSALSYHLNEKELQPSWRNSDLESNTPVKSSEIAEIATDNDPPVDVKGNLNTILPNPQIITQQIQSTINSIVHKLNNTVNALSSNSTAGISEIIGVVKNLTSSVLNKGRLEDVEHLAANISEIFKSSLDENEANLQTEVEGVLKDFQRTVMGLRKEANQDNSVPLEKRTGDNQVPDDETAKPSDFSGVARQGPMNGMEIMFDRISTFQKEVDSTIKKSLSEASRRIEDTIASTARQGSQLMRNQTNGFMNEIRRVFSVFTLPFRQFMDDVRRRVPPTAVVTA